MDIKTDKVKSILGIKPFESAHGTIYYHQLEMESGLIGEIGKKKESAFRVGDSLTFTVESTSFGNKFKEVKEFGGGGFGGSKQGSAGSARSFALSYAKDIQVAMLNVEAYPLGEDGKIDSDAMTQTILTRADAFLEWLEKGSPTQQTSTDTVSVEPEQQAFTGNGDWAKEEPKQEKPNYPPKPKPAMGGVANGGKQVSPAQLGLLKKLTTERDIDVNHMIMAEWGDVESANDLSSAAASFLIETILKGD